MTSPDKQADDIYTMVNAQVENEILKKYNKQHKDVPFDQYKNRLDTFKNKIKHFVHFVEDQKCNDIILPLVIEKFLIDNKNGIIASESDEVFKPALE
jgi:hypothetical protein